MDSLATLLGVSGTTALLAIGLFYVAVMLATNFRLNYIWTAGLFKTKMVLTLNAEAIAAGRVPNVSGLYATTGEMSSAVAGANIQNIMFYYDWNIYYRGTSGTVKPVFPTPKDDEALVLKLQKQYGIVK